MPSGFLRQGRPVCQPASARHPYASCDVVGRLLSRNLVAPLAELSGVAVLHRLVPLPTVVGSCLASPSSVSGGLG
ncbi:hypothetical protein ISN44_As03g021000 [Arabidopsis suecica]|uniref:Uncharacterized protein n=2 Tax=Arabidopsis TaxID=3701 RepID=A0A8T2FCV3_ARASU|nr:hypothetical protein ISN44_As03g021000 [Arabidopsis suecica]